MKKLVYLLAILATACSPEIRTYSDYDKEFDVSQFRTYSWSKPLADQERYPLYYNEMTGKRITSAVNDLLAVRGYVLTDSSAELTLDYTITVEERSVFLPDPYGYMYWDNYMRSRSEVFNYREATLALDVLDSKDGRLLWRGWAVGILEVVVYESSDVEVAIRSAIAKILKDFPESAKRQSVEMTIKIH
ncbi:DUF4136 domain-containing protein [Dyadobacter chenhuakuii]|uniref:DUF4136 domain-containing protein n=1 Tax=Dyadobacter chenhuakuii TaxID=2909339 RepID=A0ABY4XMH5_9BACT|nr:DUF4136 domain-containing protein [Dyadobacter chenhuakuii]MCF2494088.1 DUF4136 domain-containing protein [Dyadobacter chenhuakuii]USJ31217.1 DUF4136 domain-containing protein [Dyadobacter chenhuakuii]